MMNKANQGMNAFAAGLREKFAVEKKRKEEEKQMADEKLQTELQLKMRGLSASPLKIGE